MNERGQAFFVRRPRTIRELWSPHLLEKERPYEIIRTVRLSAVAFDNFAEDMLADRAFLEDGGEVCARGVRWKCVFVFSSAREGGVLVVPERGCFVGWAAVIPDGQ